MSAALLVERGILKAVVDLAWLGLIEGGRQGFEGSAAAAVERNIRAIRGRIAIQGLL